MILFSPARKIAIIFQFSLLYATVALGLPTNRDVSTQQTRSTAVDKALSTLSKRGISINSSAIGGIAGGAVGLILLSLFIGLGAASIALLGSLEWREWRGKNKEGENEKGKEVERGEGEGSAPHSSEPRPPPVPTKDESATNEKARPGKLSNSRLTLKSFMTMDFRPGWLPNSNK